MSHTTIKTLFKSMFLGTDKSGSQDGCGIQATKFALLSKIISEKEDDLVTNEWTAVKKWEDAAVQIWRERRSWVRRAGEK